MTALDPDATSIARFADIPWATLAPGIEMKVMRMGEGSEKYTVMNRFVPGTELPKHYHHGDVHAFTISGRWGYLEYDWIAEAGDYIYEAPGTIHTLKVPDDAPEPAVVSFVIDKGMDFYDEDGNVFHTETADSIVEFYFGCLDAEGTPRPDGVLP
jgi:2,4'-dihydroxyacetophenone dioxygenase